MACTALRAEVVDIQWSSEDRFERRIDVAAGKVAEVCGNLPSGSKIRWQFDASAPLEFNIHYHVDKDVAYPVKPATMTRADDVLAAVVAQDYCWMWRNRSAATVTLNLVLRRS